MIWRTKMQAKVKLDNFREKNSLKSDNFDAIRTYDFCLANLAEIVLFLL
jgi:hypothetical protein